MMMMKGAVCPRHDACSTRCGTQAAAHEHRRQGGSRRPGTVAKCQTTTGGRTWPPWSGRAGALVASVADGAPAICYHWWPRLPGSCWSAASICGDSLPETVRSSASSIVASLPQ